MQIFSKNNALLTIISVIMLSCLAFGQSSKKVMDYLNVAGPLSFDRQSYILTWSTHPSADFYKQEYLVQGDNIEKYKTMVLLDVMTGHQDIKGVVEAKMNELKQMKASNPMVNYDLIQNPSTGEYILDFLLTANTPKGDISIIEWNVYRYRLFNDINGKKGIQLFGLSQRGYAPAIDAFLARLKTTRKDFINKVSQYKMPEVKVLK